MAGLEIGSFGFLANLIQTEKRQTLRAQDKAIDEGKSSPPVKKDKAKKDRP